MSIRLDPNVLPTLLAGIEQSEQNQTITSDELASGRSVNEPSDNPSATAALVYSHNEDSEDGQFLQNISDLQGRFQVADSTLSNVVESLTQAVSIGTEGANGTVSASDRQALAAQVQGILTQTMGLANTNYQGAYLFGGTNVTTQPFTQNGGTGAITYNGNSNATSVELSNGNSIVANVAGNQLFQNSNGNVLGSLQDLYNALQSGNNISTAVNEVSNALTELSTQRVTYGNALDQINTSESFLNQDQLNVAQQENELEGADLSVVTTDFAQAQLANQATIGATSQILGQKNLLDYLA